MGEYKLSRTTKHRVAINMATLLDFIAGLVSLCNEGQSTQVSDNNSVRITLGSDTVEFKSPDEFGTFIRAFPPWQTPDSISINVFNMTKAPSAGGSRYVCVEFSHDTTRVYVSSGDLFWTHQTLPTVMDQLSSYALPMRPMVLRNWGPALALPLFVTLLVLLQLHGFIIFLSAIVYGFCSAIWATAPANTPMKRRYNPKNILVLR